MGEFPHLGIDRRSRRRCLIATCRDRRHIGGSARGVGYLRLVVAVAIEGMDDATSHGDFRLAGIAGRARRCGGSRAVKVSDDDLSWKFKPIVPARSSSSRQVAVPAPEQRQWPWRPRDVTVARSVRPSDGGDHRKRAYGTIHAAASPPASTVSPRPTPGKPGHHHTKVETLPRDFNLCARGGQRRRLLNQVRGWGPRPAALAVVVGARPGRTSSARAAALGPRPRPRRH